MPDDRSQTTTAYSALGALSLCHLLNDMVQSLLPPLLAAFIVLPLGQGSVSWFAIAPLTAMVVLWKVGLWYRAHVQAAGTARGAGHAPHHHLSRRQVGLALGVLLVLVFSKYV